MIKSGWLPRSNSLVVFFLSTPRARGRPRMPRAPISQRRARVAPTPIVPSGRRGPPGLFFFGPKASKSDLGAIFVASLRPPGAKSLSAGILDRFGNDFEISGPSNILNNCRTVMNNSDFCICFTKSSKHVPPGGLQRPPGRHPGPHWRVKPV